MDRRALALFAAAPLAVAAAAPSALAAPSGPASGVCVVQPVKQVQGGKVTVGVNIANAASTAARQARCGRVANVVRGLAGSAAEMPMRVNGFRCTPTVRGREVIWACTYRGGSPRTAVTLDFAYRYRA